jgi:long-chain acyl-CoA synthetase
MGLNVGQILRQSALRAPERVILVERDGEERREWTAGELEQSARSVAARLRASGITRGDRVGLIGENSAAFAAAFFGAAYVGASVVPIPFRSTEPEIDHRVASSQARAVLFDEPRRERVMRVTESRHALGVPLDEAAGYGAIDSPPEECDASETALILYTSGTTGLTKGACISHAALLTHTAGLVHHVLRFDDRVVALGALPLTHSYGLRMVLLAPFFAGGRAVLMPRFSSSQLRQVCREEGVTWFPGVPTMFAALAGDGGDPLDTLVWALSAGAPLPGELADRAGESLGCPVRQGYGLTEATFTCIDAPPASPTRGSVGRAVWGVEVAILGEDGPHATPDVLGEILVRGQNVMTCYLNDPAATSEVFHDGWLRTGDVGRLDDAGRLFVVDREKDLILRGGENVYPSEVEDVLHRMPEVSEAAVIGVADAYYGEEVVAVVRVAQGRSLGIEAIDEHCRALLSSHKIPRALAQVESFPLGPSGKILKRELRRMLEEGALALERGTSAR